MGVGPYREHLSLDRALCGNNVLLTADALWLFDLHTRMRVRPSSGGKVRVLCGQIGVSCLARGVSCVFRLIV